MLQSTIRKQRLLLHRERVCDNYILRISGKETLKNLGSHVRDIIADTYAKNVKELPTK